MTNHVSASAISAEESTASAGRQEDRVATEALQFPDIPRLELDQLLEQLRDRADDVLSTQGRLRGLLRANAAVAADLSLPALLRHIVDAARNLLGARYAAIVVLGREARLQEFVHVGMDEDLVGRIRELPSGQGVRDLLTAGFDSNGAPGSLPVGAGPFAPGHPSVGGFLGVPVHVGDRAFGTLYLKALPGGAFSAEDEQLVTALAATAGVAIANARLLADSEHRRRWLTASSQMTNLLLTAGTVDRLRCVTEAAITAADADWAIVTLPQGEDDVTVAVTAGEAASGLTGRTAAADTCQPGRVIRSGIPALLSHDSRDTDPLGMSLTGGSSMTVPLTAGGHARGAVTIGRVDSRDGFTETELDMATSFGIQAAVALALAEARDTQISNAQLEDHDRIAFDMHDNVIGELFALGMGLQGLASVTDKPAHISRINVYVDSLDRVIRTIRSTIFRLQRHLHDPAGLQTRIVAIAESHTEQLGYAPLIHVTGPIDLLVDEPLAADVLAVTREALSNCARHARASKVTISAVLAADTFTLEITDNGKGIGKPTRSSGLRNMRLRAENRGGRLAVTEPDDGGTRLTWSAPWQPAPVGPPMQESSRPGS